jgi:hypothetical protein
MLGSIIAISFADHRALAAFVEKQLMSGHAAIVSDRPAELFDDVVLRLETPGGTADIPASVAHPGLVTEDGARLGLAVKLTPAQQAELEILVAAARQIAELDPEFADTSEMAVLDAPLVRGRTVPPTAELAALLPAADTIALDDPVAAAEVVAAAVAEALAADEPETEDAAAEPSTSTEVDESTVTEAADSKRKTLRGHPTEPVEDELDTGRSTGPIDITSAVITSSGVSLPVNPLQGVARPPAPRGEIDDRIHVYGPKRGQTIVSYRPNPVGEAPPTSLPDDTDDANGANDSDPFSRSQEMTPSKDSAAEYRSMYPAKAKRAAAYFDAAQADVKAGAFETARTNLNLAIAYNPTEHAYRELLDDVSAKLERGTD